MRFADPFTTTQEDTQKVKPKTTGQTVEVKADGEGLVSHAGAYLLTELADRIGLTGALSAAMTPTRERRSAHDPGVVLRNLAVSIADGGDCVSDLGVLGGQEALFGAVASQTTAHRVIKSIDEPLLEAIRAARAKARGRAWEAGARPTELILDIDATLITAHSEKEDAVGNYKGGFGFHPLLCYLAETGEPLAGLLRPGNAGSNTAADHFCVLQMALEQLPETDLHREILVRTDVGGRTKAFAADCRSAGIRFSVGCELRDRAREAIVSLPQSAWRGAIDAEGRARAGAQVAELSDHIDLSAWPQGTRLIVRRERPHPGAQFQVFDADGHRHTAFITDQPDADIAALELRHRQKGPRGGRDPHRQRHRHAKHALRRLRPQQDLAGALADRPGADLLCPRPLPDRRASPRRAQAHPPAPPSRRRPPRALGPACEASPAAQLALGGGARRRLRSAAGAAGRGGSVGAAAFPAESRTPSSGRKAA
jgi:hypothetical protein